MGDFKKFLTEFKEKNQNLLLTEGDINQNLLNIKSQLDLIPELNMNEKNQFAEEMISFATSDEFIDILDSKLPPPLPGEDKDAFVKRGLNMIRNLLLDKMG